MHPIFDSPLTPLGRRTVTLFCFLVAVSILSSMFIYIDSNSLTTWSECNEDVGPVAMRVTGDNLHLVLDEIRGIPHVTQASLVETAPAYLRMDKSQVYVGSVLSFVVMQMPLTYLGLSTEVSWGRLPLVMSVPFVLIVKILALAVLFSMVVTY